MPLNWLKSWSERERGKNSIYKFCVEYVLTKSGFTITNWNPIVKIFEQYRKEIDKKN
jgi:hypothetical protein